MCSQKQTVNNDRLWMPSDRNRSDKWPLSLLVSSEISSQDCYDIPRTFPNDRSNSLEGFHNHFVSMT